MVMRLMDYSGMARIFSAAPALVQLMNGMAWEMTGLPDVYEITAERLQRMHTASRDTAKVVTI